MREKNTCQSKISWAVTNNNQWVLVEFLCFLLGFFGGFHLRLLISTVRLGFLYSADFKCSSISLGVTQITCWPFQYLTRFKDCSVEIMSFWNKISFHENLCLVFKKNIHSTSLAEIHPRGGGDLTHLRRSLLLDLS